MFSLSASLALAYSLTQRLKQQYAAAFGASTFSRFTFIIPDFGDYAGDFQITSLEYAGEYNGEATYSMSFESAGAVGFTAA